MYLNTCVKRNTVKLQNVRQNNYSQIAYFAVYPIDLGNSLFKCVKITTVKLHF